ncbi:MAG: family 10 glycosylhydrolase, partial [Planctomycetaceae bacterium]|nr:family 10 glycosylhydrolase [Planctomycetaceae bacterium]
RQLAPRFQDLSEALNEIRQDAVQKYCTSISPKLPEFRAWWEHAGLGAYPGDWERTMKELSESGFNAVISNLLWGGSANYPSDVIPHSKKFEQYGDQVEQAIKAGKKYGVEVHAWQVCWRLEGSPPEYIEAMKKSGRTQKSFNGTDTIWLCPSHPENIELECRTLCELVQKYPDLAGIHLDYIRYPDGDHCYCDGCRERFVKETGCNITNWTQDVRNNGIHTEKYRQWRCDNITKLVERVHREAKKTRSNIKISAAVLENYPTCRRGTGQDWVLWCEKGYLDFICPMDYTKTLDYFETTIERQKKLIGGKIPLYPGIGATATGIAMTPDRVAAEIQIARKQNTSGFVIFNLDSRTIQSIPPILKLGVTRP